MTELVVHTLYLVHVLAIKVFSRVFSKNVTQRRFYCRPRQFTTGHWSAKFLFLWWPLRRFCHHEKTKIAIYRVDKIGRQFAVFANEWASLPFQQQKGQMVMYDGKKELEWWKQGTMCDKVGGNDGSTLPPGLNEQSEVDMWIALMCRSIKLKFEKVSLQWRESV